jgi:hypothetical protein
MSSAVERADPAGPVVLPGCQPHRITFRVRTCFTFTHYWLWGLNVGLTEDPLRCHQVLRLFL